MKGGGVIGPARFRPRFVLPEAVAGASVGVDFRAVGNSGPGMLAVTACADAVTGAAATAATDGVAATSPYAAATAATNGAAADEARSSGGTATEDEALLRQVLICVTCKSGWLQETLMFVYCCFGCKAKLH